MNHLKKLVIPFILMKNEPVIGSKVTSIFYYKMLYYGPKYTTEEKDLIF